MKITDHSEGKQNTFKNETDENFTRPFFDDGLGGAKKQGNSQQSLTTWPGWQNVRTLGTGSFGSVYEIQKVENGVTYRAALKVITIPPNESDIKEKYHEGMDEQSVTEYFRSYVDNITQEFALMSHLKGLNTIVSYEDHMVVEHENGIGWDILIRMELLTPLTEYAAKNKLDEKEIIRMGLDMCEALSICHKNGIIHRDIKPGNIFVNDYGYFKLGDFGIARMMSNASENMSQKGTFAYMAPEVFHGCHYDIRADIYSLGMVLYFFLNENRMPFLPPAPATYTPIDRNQAIQKRLSGETVPDSVNGRPELQSIIKKALSYRAEERYETADQMKGDLEKLWTSDTSASSKPRLIPVVLAVILLAVLVTVAFNELPVPIPPVESSSVEVTSVEDTSTETSSTDAPSAEPSSTATLPEASSRNEYDNDGSLLEYDEKNRLIKITYSHPKYYTQYFDSYASWLGWCAYEYDDSDKITTATYYRKDGSVFIRKEYQYDGEGKQTNLTVYDADGTLSGWSEWKYDTDGRVTKRTSYDSDGSLSSFRTFEYDTNKNTITQSIYNADRLLSSVEMYDTNGNLTEKTEYDYNAEGKVSSYVIYKYDKDGLMSEGTGYRSDDSLYYQLEYDSNGNVIKKTIYNKDKTVSSWRENQYDENNHVLKKTNYDADGSVLGWFSYAYDTDGNRIKRTRYSANGDMIEWIEYNCNAAEDGPAERCYDVDGSLCYTIKYRYDVDGNYTSVSYDPEGNKFSDSSTSYNKDGSKKKVTYKNASGKVIGQKKYGYDVDGNQSSTYIKGK